MKTNRISKMLLLTLVSLILVFCSAPLAMATGTYSTESSVSGQIGEGKNINTLSNSVNSQVPNVQVQEVESWIDRKGGDVIRVLQKFAQPFSVIIFISGAIMSLFGIFGNGKMFWKGVIGMGIAVVMYTVILYSPEILDFLQVWLST